MPGYSTAAVPASRTVRRAVAELVALGLLAWDAIGRCFTLLIGFKGPAKFSPSNGKRCPLPTGQIFPSPARPTRGTRANPDQERELKDDDEVIASAPPVEPSSSSTPSIQEPREATPAPVQAVPMDTPVNPPAALAPAELDALAARVEVQLPAVENPRAAVKAACQDFAPMAAANGPPFQASWIAEALDIAERAKGSWGYVRGILTRRCRGDYTAPKPKVKPAATKYYRAAPIPPRDPSLPSLRAVMAMKGGPS
jgi:hypothetical protein